MSKSPSSEPQFQSGLNQSFQGLALSGGGASSPPATPASPARPKIMIEYKELKFGARKGKGAYGEVFEGQYHKEKVAIKVYDFRGQLSAQEQADIVQEAELMEGLRSQYLVGFRGICLDERYCLVMEYCDGGTLRGRLYKTDQPIHLPDQLRWAQQISYGIYKLHSIRIIHRDLKGENVLLDRHGDAKVADFGLSVVKSSSSKADSGIQIAGTLPWMAPELFERKPNGPATDVYSLGMVLWEIISRKNPFAGMIPAAIAGMIMMGKREVIDESWPLVFRTLIQACWDADPTKRPSTERVGDEFKAALESLEAAPKPVSESAAELELEVEQLREQFLFAKLRKKAAAQEQKLQAKKKQKETAQLLKLVARGEQDLADVMIQQNKSLLLASGPVTDLSGRAFQNITAFQYALWAMDWHMWTMIKKYLPKEAQAQQFNELETKGTEHGKHYDIKPLTDALQTYVDNAPKWNYDQRADDQWNKVVGGAQIRLPAHVVNEYARPDRPFEPCPTEWESKLPRSCEVDVYNGSQWVKGSWFIAPSSQWVLGSTFAFYRYSNKTAVVGGARVSEVWWGGNGAYDLKALQSLWKARTQQLELLSSELAAVSSQTPASPPATAVIDSIYPPLSPLIYPPQPPAVRPSQSPQSLMPAPKPAVDAKALGQLLKLVAEGEQDQAETMIQQNKQLLLASEQVTDLSGRTFQSVTAFQYALWAMDYHMWTMIKKYLPKEAQTQQLQVLETKGTEHGKHYDIKPLTDALQTYVDNAAKWKYDQRAADQWNKVIGGAQKLAPAHAVNEYARPDRPFQPCPTEWESKLPRTREMDVWDSAQSKYVKGSWFIAPSPKDSLGSTFAFYRHSVARGRGEVRVADRPCRVDFAAKSDLIALQSLWKARTQQLESLKSELLSAAPVQGMQSLGFK